jgi:UDP-3-O-[3-hydroxymyristoyl] glucosamine N-acyltransferase
MALSLRELAQRIGADLQGDGSIEVESCCGIETAGPRDVTFLANDKYRRYLASTRAAAVIIDHRTECPEGLNRLLAKDPYFAFRNAVIELYGFRKHPTPIAAGPTSISSLASVHPESRIGAGSQIHPGVVIERGAALGQRCILYPGCYVGCDTKLGDECVLFPNVVVYDRCVIGNRVTIHANSVIGQDGFGYATHRGAHHKIPQAGIALIEDDVEIGAGCTIERATIGETRIGAGTKFADLISIGHGAKIGRHCLFVSLVGISGSVEVGDYVVMGGQAGAVGHLTIGTGAQVGAQTGITNDVDPGAKVWGTPAVELEQARRNAVIGRDLAGLAKRVRELERELQRINAEHVEASARPHA